MERIAPGLQKTISDFMALSSWEVTVADEKGFRARKRMAGRELLWAFHFEDEHSISQAGSSVDFERRLSQNAGEVQLFDLILPEKAVVSRNWNDYLKPALERAWPSSGNKRFGTTTEFLNRFSTEIGEAFATEVTNRLRVHFVTFPVRPSFTSSDDALAKCANWIDTPDSSRLMLVTGDAGAGKSVFSLMALQEFQQKFVRDPDRYPAPFLIWFTKDRPATIDDLIALTLNDIGLAQSVTPSSVRFLLEQGRLMFILDGFDEVSRALAQNAEQNIDELSKNINRRTRGRLLLTARPSFVMQEDLFATLKSSCEDESPEQYELAPYTDSQMREWVVRNPPEGALSPSERHWQRIDTAFRQNPSVKELCRTPVFLRMMSEVLVGQASVRSLCDLFDEFCVRMWERERSKRSLTLSDEQYFHAYEAVSLAVEEEKRIEAQEIRDVLGLYFEAYYPELLGSLPGSARTLIDDLSIGPLTFKNGRFVFVHEVLAAYFLGRFMVRHLVARKDVTQLWNRPLRDTLRKVLPDIAANVASPPLESERVLREVVLPISEGLAAWNIVAALRVAREKYPRNLLSRKRLAGIVFDQENLEGLSFDEAEVLDVVFDRCALRGATFRGVVIHKLKFIQCGPGAVFDDSIQIREDTEVSISRGDEAGTELYTGEACRSVLKELSSGPREVLPLPKDLAKRALVTVLSSLFKSDLRKYDYPEWAKVENRLRGWLRLFRMPEGIQKEVARVLLRLADDLRDEGWVSRNPSRPRTFAPSHQREEAVSKIVRLQDTSGISADLDEMLRKCQEKLNSITTGLV